MPPKSKRSQRKVSRKNVEPSDPQQPAPQMTAVLSDVLSELKSLKDQVNSMKEEAANDRQPLPSTSGMSAIPPTRVPSSSLPMVDIIPENLRRDILKGKNINLAQLLLPARERGMFVGNRDIKIGEETLTLKPLKDERLLKHLTIQEFIQAFNMYKNVLCEVFPDRRNELDEYQSNIIGISAKYPGFSFYEYHLEFAGRAAFFLEHRNIAVDWAIMDERLLTQIVAGRQANICSLCNAFDHSTRFCPKNAEKTGYNNSRTCSYYNTARGCHRKSCAFKHECSKCSGQHSMQNCTVQSN